MDKKLFKSLILLVTYVAVLVLIIVNFSEVLVLGKKALGQIEPLLIGFVIAFILNRPCRFFRRLYSRGLRGNAEKLALPLAVVSAYVMLIAAIVAIFSIVLPHFADSLALFISNIGSYATQMQEWVNYLLERFDLELLEWLDLSNLSQALQDVMSGALNLLTSTLPQILSIAGTVVSVVVTGVLAFVFSIYMLASGDRLLTQCRNLVKAYAPERLRQTIFDVGRLTADTFTKFIGGQLIEACILGCLCCVGMWILRLPYAPLIGVIIGVCALVPIAGAYIGAIVSALLLLMVSPAKALVFLIFLVILQQLEGNLIYPRVVGGSVGLPGIWVLAAVTVGGGLFGFVGMLIGVPTASVLYALLRQDVNRRLSKKVIPPQISEREE